MVSTDREIFREGSEAHARMLEYGAIVKELHIIVFSKSSLGLKSKQVGENVWLYPTSSSNRWMYIFDAAAIGRRIFSISAEVNMAGEKVGIEEKLADLVTTQDPFECGFSGWLIAKKINVPLHLQIHTDFLSPYFSSESFLNKIRVFLAKFLLRRAVGGARVVSERIKNSIAEKIKFPYGKFPNITLLPIFVDIDAYKNASPLFDLHQRFPDWRRIVLVVSRLEREKGVDTALEVFAGLPITGFMSAGLVVAGDGSERPSLEKIAKRLGLAERVAFLGWVPDLVSLYKTADLLLVTSRYEGYGRQIIEAAASGCPVLSYDVGVAPEALTYWNGSICPALDLKCMRDALFNWFVEKGLSENLIIASRGAAEKMKGETKEEYLQKYQEMWENAAI